MSNKQRLVCIISLLATLTLSTQAAPAPKDWQHTPGTTATQARAQWQQLTAGDDLARGKAVRFYPQPNYRLTTDDNDAHDLTDGTLSSRADDRVWFNKDAVGWIQYGAKQDTSVVFYLDLGSIQPVGQIAIRVLGGREQNSLTLPDGVEFLASVDGQKYFSLQNSTRLGAPNDAGIHFTNSYSVRQEGKAFMYPIVCREAVNVRYIAMRVTPQYSLFTDQISVLKADAKTSLKDLNQYPPARLFTGGAAAIPRHNSFVVTTNVTTPIWFSVHYFDNKDSSSKISLRLDLPQALQLLPGTKPNFTEVTSSASGIRSYEFADVGKRAGYQQANLNGPLFVQLTPGQSIPKDAKAVFTTSVNDTVSNRVEYPIQIINVPEVPAGISSIFDVSLGWIGIEQQLQWPNYLSSSRKMGFSYIPTFPRYLNDGTGYWSKTTALKLLDDARRQKFGVVYEESPIHVMFSTVNALRKAGKLSPEEINDIYSQPDGKVGTHLNPFYRGKYYQNEMERITDLTRLVKPDQAHLDIELWTASVPDASKDPRVIALAKKDGETVNDVLISAGTEMLSDITKAIRDNAPNSQLPIGLFDAEANPNHPVMGGIFQWTKIHPRSVNIAQPADYVIGDVLAVADDVRANYNAMGNRDIIPWLSPGTNGEFDPSLLEPMLLETLLNGAKGFTYYIYTDFDPMDFYYQSKALSELAPYQTLLKNGKPLSYQGTDPDLHYTCFASSNEALLLVGNYRGNSKGKVTLKLPLSSATKVLLDGKPLPINDNNITLNVPPGEFRLIDVSK